MALLLKDLYNETYINLLSKSISKHYPAFNEEKFTLYIFDAAFFQRELKSRMRHISSSLALFLPKPYENAVAILKAAFFEMNYAFGLENMIFQDFVEVYGLDDVDISMSALASFTINSSSEFAIRAFILKYPQRAMKQMSQWSQNSNEHIRRLASEGCRPRLPWAVSLPLFKQDPSEVLKILTLLRDDESKYVRKSVANNLNDISKDNPFLIKTLLKEWLGISSVRDSLLKHAARTLLKASDTETLEFFGFTKPTSLLLKDFKMPTEVKMGETLEFSFTLNTDKELGQLRIEFALHFLRKNNKHNKKVFKIAEGIYKSQDKKISKNYSFKPISTRVYYRGLQKLSIIINGVVFKEVEFILS